MAATTESTLANLLKVFDVQPAGNGRYVGTSDAGDRDLIDGSQLLAQSIVAASKTCEPKVVRRADATFCRSTQAHKDIDFDVCVLQSGRSFATAVVTASQGDRACATVTLLLDVPGPDVARHDAPATSAAPDGGQPFDMPLPGRELRLDVTDPNDPEDVGPARLAAWVRYDDPPTRTDLARALLAHFTGHLSISTTLRAHKGLGTALSHRTLSTAPMSISVSFHEPLECTGWLRYDHESTYLGAGMSYVRGQITSETDRLLASFSQDAMVRALEAGTAAAALSERARL